MCSIEIKEDGKALASEERKKRVKDMSNQKKICRNVGISRRRRLAISVSSCKHLDRTQPEKRPPVVARRLTCPPSAHSNSRPVHEEVINKYRKTITRDGN
jgi:hypothetical protein